MKFDVVRSGGCWLVGGGKTTRLAAGDCFMMSGNAFTLASDPAIQPADAASVFAADTSCGEIGSGADVDILGGSITFAPNQGDLLLPLLPHALIISHDAEDASAIQWLVTRLDTEWRSGFAGARAACDDIIRLLFVQALRRMFSRPDTVPSWLAGLSDPPVARALGAIHVDPGRPWRLGELAAIAGQSRSAFSGRFHPPGRYGTHSLCGKVAVASRGQGTGHKFNGDWDDCQLCRYQSDSAFHAAFRRELGLTPAAYRRACLGRAE